MVSVPEDLETTLEAALYVATEESFDMLFGYNLATAKTADLAEAQIEQYVLGLRDQYPALSTYAERCPAWMLYILPVGLLSMWCHDQRATDRFFDYMLNGYPDRDIGIPNNVLAEYKLTDKTLKLAAMLTELGTPGVDIPCWKILRYQQICVLFSERGVKELSDSVGRAAFAWQCLRLTCFH